jgi:hypothetical protein
MIVITSAIDSLATAETMLTSSTVAEPDLTMGEAAWNPATNYTLGTVVIRSTTHRRYENTLAGVDAGLPEAAASASRWLDVGPTNKYAMFDTLRDTQTEASSPLTVVLTPGERIDAIGVAGLEAAEISISMTVDAVEVYTYTESLSTRDVLGWYDFFFEPFTFKPTVARFDIPPYTNGVITITITTETGTVKCGAVIIGRQTYIGKLQLGAVSEEQNFSRIEREFDGTATLIQRRSIPKLTGQVFADKANTNRIRKLRTNLNAIPAFWSGLDDSTDDDFYDATQIIGIYKRFEIDITYPEHTLINLEVEEI